nr:hypothetical protein CFP56_34633 [Quercus suber]
MASGGESSVYRTTCFKRTKMKVFHGIPCWLIKRTNLRKIGHSLILSSSHHLLPSSSSLLHHTNTTNNNTNCSTFAQQSHSPLIYNWIGY